MDVKKLIAKRAEDFRCFAETSAAPDLEQVYIDPCPSYFECGDDMAYGVYIRHRDGVMGDFIAIFDGPAATWQAWKWCDENGLAALRGPNCAYVR